ncbi:hypothetical protein KA071_02760 [Candidatus Gracilibacteria bacterium]|nr:hypothetical protein [Candidatus Gracilibacteria bacterium]
MKNPLSSHSPNPDRLLAHGISRTARALKYPEIDTLRQRALAVLRRKEHTPLSAEELQIIQDCLMSQPGGEALALVNHRLFCDFDYEKILRERHFLDQTLSGLSEFEHGGQNRHSGLAKTAQAISAFSQSEKGKEPRQITPQEIWNYVQLRQSQAVHSQNKRLFAEACVGDKTQALYTCENTKIPTTLRFDSKHQIIGGWSEDGKIIGKTVIAGLHPVAPAFYGDEITVPCADAKGELNLLEFDPHGFFTFGNIPRGHISVIPSKNIGKRAVVRNMNPLDPELFYCFVHNYGSPKIIHSGPGGTVVSNQPIREFNIDGDIIFVAHASSESCASYKIHSLQTGGYVEIERKNIDKEEETKDDIVFTLREGDAFDGTLHLPGKESVKWEFGKKWWTKKTISLRELAQIWRETAQKAKDRNPR